MPASIRPWWEWALFWIAVAGAVKSLMVDPFYAWLTRTPKIKGEIRAIYIASGGVAKSNIVSDDTALDSEVRMNIVAFNKRNRTTWLKRWELRVWPSGGGPIIVPSLTSDQIQKKVWTVAQSHDPLMPDTIEFADHQPREGWLFFRVPNINTRTLAHSQYSLQAVDLDGKHHSIGSGVLPSREI